MKLFVKLSEITVAVVLCTVAGYSAAQPTPARDEFFWLGEINKAMAVINTDEGLLDKALAPRFAPGIAKVIKDGSLPGVRRVSTAWRTRRKCGPTVRWSTAPSLFCATGTG